MGIRPTTDRLRESIFNLIGRHMRGKRILDLFAGTGAMGIEALSRGASHATLIDRSTQSVNLIRRNIAKVGAEDWTTIIRWDITRNLRCLDGRGRFDLVFVDPPYRKHLIATTLTNMAAADAAYGRIVVEHAASESVPDVSAGLQLVDQRRYGKTLVSILSPMV